MKSVREPIHAAVVVHDYRRYGSSRLVCFLQAFDVLSVDRHSVLRAAIRLDTRDLNVFDLSPFTL
jgi:hypothetical protein